MNETIFVVMTDFFSCYPSFSRDINFSLLAQKLILECGIRNSIFTLFKGQHSTRGFRLDITFVIDKWIQITTFYVPLVSLILIISTIRMFPVITL